MANEIIEANAFETDAIKSSFDGTGDTMFRLKAISAMNTAESLNDHMNEIIKVCDYVIMPGVRKGRGNNPDSRCQNTYIFDTDGNAFFTQSDGVANDLQKFIHFCPDLGKQSMPLGYLPLKCVSRPLPNGNTIKNLIIADE